VGGSRENNCRRSPLRVELRVSEAGADGVNRGEAEEEEESEGGLLSSPENEKGEERITPRQSLKKKE